MATEYLIRCETHRNGWPDNLARAWQLPTLEAIIRHRFLIVGVHDLHPDLTIVFETLGAPGDFLRNHPSCTLELANEYGDVVGVDGERLRTDGR